jgi:hypothetical protein
MSDIWVVFDKDGAFQAAGNSVLHAWAISLTLSQDTEIYLWHETDEEERREVESHRDFHAALGWTCQRVYTLEQAREELYIEDQQHS